MTVTNAPLIIIGTGLAGYNVLKEFRKIDGQAPVLMISSDDGASYSKPMLSTGFTKNKTALELEMATATKMAEQFNVEIRTKTNVTSIDPEAHQISIDDEIITYSKLVLAWGASAINLTIEGGADEHIFSINSLEDYAIFRQNLEGKKRVLIMGAGLIGCEYANDLVNGGYDVTVIAPATQLLPALLPEPAAKAVQNGLEGLGVTFILGPIAQRVIEKDNAVEVTLSNGNVITTDIIISAVGIRPRTELAAMSGFQVNRGIVVDRTLETNHKDVYAVGDCAEVDGNVLLYVLPLMAGARALAKTLTGTATEVSYMVMPVGVKTPVVPIALVPVSPDTEGEWNIEVDGNNVKAELRNANGALLGYALTGESVKEKMALNKEITPTFFA
jgi:rubredoxin-NAD+ reductase